MRVALVNLTTTTKVGGVETFVWELAGRLAEHGVAVTVIGGKTAVPPVRQPLPNVEIITAPYIDRATLRRVPLLGRRYGLTKLLERLSFGLRARRAIERGGFDIVHIHKPFDLPLAAWVRARTGARIVYSSHGRDFFPADRRFAAAVSVFTACSAYNAGEVRERYRRDARVIFNGIDTEQFAPQPPDNAWRAAHAAGDAPLVLWVGRLERWKGTIDVLRAIALLDRDCPAHLAVVGAGPEIGRLRAAAQSLGIHDRVHFLGTCDHAALPRIYSTCDLVVGTSFANETFGMAMAEASACARPVIATRFGGFPEVVRDNETGLLVPPRDPHALATAIRMLMCDPARGRAMGDAGRAHIVANFAWSVVTERVLRVYREALDED
ncbi:MAG: glycosyltransferase family 4 protein [Chloroflexota bacterium]|nr:glycosyltransferase family 4 protein [Chloroflexota bacterium]